MLKIRGSRWEPPATAATPDDRVKKIIGKLADSYMVIKSVFWTKLKNGDDLGQVKIVDGELAAWRVLVRLPNGELKRIEDVIPSLHGRMVERVDYLDQAGWFVLEAKRGPINTHRLAQGDELFWIED
ncbi:MAG TPA: hypothetical protein VGL56_19145 [Fimbriimonadaceae bacterium]|jgi:hypothetical protein